MLVGCRKYRPRTVTPFVGFHAWRGLTCQILPWRQASKHETLALAPQRAPVATGPGGRYLGGGGYSTAGRWGVCFGFRTVIQQSGATSTQPITHRPGTNKPTEDDTYSTIHTTQRGNLRADHIRPRVFSRRGPEATSVTRALTTVEVLDRFHAWLAHGRWCEARALR